MKKSGIVLLLLLLPVAIACNKVKPKKVEKTMTSGSWVITVFTEDGLNETPHFSGYVFTFSDGGTVSAVNGGTTVNGTWSATKSSDDDDSKNAHFTLNFPDIYNFDEISDDWHIESLEDNRLELMDVSGGDNSTEYLVFEKQ